MTKKDFKYALQRGLGCCVIELQQTDKKEEYKDLVLWACTHDLAYDTQCEGTRSRYLYELIRCYADTEIFLQEIIRQFNQNLTSYDGWDFNRCCELLELFAADGNLNAYQVLETGYKTIYKLLQNVKERDDIGSELFNNFETLCISIVNFKSAPNTDTVKEEFDSQCSSKIYLLPRKMNRLWSDSFCAIIEDIGRLLDENSNLDVCDFDYFQLFWKSEMGKLPVQELLKERSGKSPLIKTYVDAYERQKENTAQFRQNYEHLLTAEGVYSTLKNGGKSGRDIPIMIGSTMLNKGKCDEVKKLAEYYKEEKEEDIRAELLFLLGNRKCANLLDACSVIGDADSYNEELRNNAVRALTEMKSEKVRDYALSVIDDTDCPEDVISMLVHNYHKEDYDQFVKLLYDLPISYEDCGWHGAFISIIDVFEEKEPHSLPTEILSYMYSETLCSCCRQGIVKEMGRQNLLSDKILRECLHDSNDDIREYAEKVILCNGKAEI
ncbi:MAG: hypothetical protein K2M60_11080 [Lachnospiraceae bacterium]|nr:hypothetical protein [Lachnospiraceae bacterium]MDE6251885.1 hypothetical protein [Lachnospiraceae bacterium]